MLKEILVGTCGFSAKGGKKNYYKVFKVVEVQDTFYRIVRKETLEKWRKEAPEDFEFTIKAFQGVTHTTSSPTWRRSNIKLDPSSKDNYGNFKPTKEVDDSWKYTLSAAKILRSQFIVVQTPASFKPTEENIENLKKFFQEKPRDNIIVGWEPRGAWYNNQELLSSLLKELKLVHIVDPLKRPVLFHTETYYFRLHGLGRGDVNYRYKYTTEDLERLAEILENLSGKRAYVMFNNVYMYDNALEFKEMLKNKGYNVL